MTVGEYGDSVNGKKIDFDGAYSNQCWDIAADYAKKMFGCPDFPTGDGWADGSFKFFDSLPYLKNYFNKVVNNPNDVNQLPKQGDIVFWTNFNSSGLPHVAVYWRLSRVNYGIFIDQFQGINAGYHERSFNNVIGWLTPKASAPATPPPIDPTIALNSQINDLTAKLQIANTTIKSLNDQVALLKNQNQDLQSRLSTSSEDTKLINDGATWFKRLLIRIGLSK